MKKILISAMVFLFVLSTAAFAAQTRGIVVSLDVNAPAITVKEVDGNVIKLEITPKTDIQRGMKDIPLDTLVPGTIVQVRYKVRDGKKIAKYIGYESGELQHFGTMKK